MQDLRHLFDSSATPAYAVGAGGVVAYANAALCEWVCLPEASVVGRRVAYHSEPGPVDGSGPLTGLCPPPAAFQQTASEGTLSVMGQHGRLRHRRARFFSLAGEATQRAVVGVLEEFDLTPQQLAASITNEPSEDELHRDIRRFRRGVAEADATAILLGDSPAARLMRTQFDLASRTPVGASVVSACGADAAAIARAIHHGAHDTQIRLLPIDCARLDSESAAAVLDQHREQLSSSTVVLLQADAADPPTQQLLATRLLAARPKRLLATLSARPAALEATLLPLVGAVVIECPPLADRISDLPMLAQFYVERANAASGARVGRVATETLDLLAMYDWPHGAGQLAEAVASAHAKCLSQDATAAEITADHLPTVVRHAALAAGLSGDPRVEIDLDEFLGRIERELVERALAKASGNRAEAARLLGLTRQRFYRRLESLGLHDPDKKQPGDSGD
ncbi:Transcriptional regulatory protein ZraR [Posidoniimonas polymericola]|uniref:Transcriptional regulatory protein ZraR n=1 Tax=Posidoniimonas polymericola TaxID=2528002 RepID=A0A5C5YRY1_9BACT|nr:helix-turn-helix domain-containing protein [Posidoniimonas polymericola]TWT77734.1 Transcriptional regulatory protein ZraR [Posidoniimonas polymericola]